MTKRDVDSELKISYIKLTLKWCKKNLGINRRKRKKLTLKFSDEKKIRKNCVYHGDYSFERNAITIYIANCDTILDVVSTVIHEYTHYLQFATVYKRYSKIYYYSQNPYERQAKRNEKKYTKICLQEITKNIK